MTATRPYETALVLGLGSSGVASALMLAGEGARVTAVDSADTPALRESAAALERAGVAAMLGRKTVPEGRFSVCVVSPGIPAGAEWVRTVEARGIEVLAELELAWRRRGRYRVLAITGSNGKSTMAKLCKEAIERAGARAEVAGNYGLPVSSVVREKRELDWLVLEVSSFQLERVADFRPDVGVLLNVLPNHLDRHGDMETYTGLKCRVFARMGKGDTAVVCSELAGKARSLCRGGQSWVTFGIAGSTDVRYEPGSVACRGPAGAPRRVPVAGTFLDNEILGLTAAASVAAVQACGFSPDLVGEAARNFQPLPHRMEKIVEIRGVEFVDNSKATNVAALSAALRMTSRPARLIAGGRPKEKEFFSVKELLAKKAVMVYLIGEAKYAMESAWNDVVPCRLFDDLAAAMEAAWKDARAGETVLLAPGCTSFDQFRNFEQRGERFAELARSFKEKEKEK